MPNESLATAVQAIELIREATGKKDIQIPAVLFLLHLGIEGTIYQKDLGDIIGLSRAAVGRNVELMEGLGLVRSVRDEENWRRNSLSLTAAGEKLIAKIEAIHLQP